MRLFDLFESIMSGNFFQFYCCFDFEETNTKYHSIYKSVTSKKIRMTYNHLI